MHADYHRLYIVLNSREQQKLPLAKNGTNWALVSIVNLKDKRYQII